LLIELSIQFVRQVAHASIPPPSIIRPKSCSKSDRAGFVLSHPWHDETVPRMGHPLICALSKGEPPVRPAGAEAHLLLSAICGTAKVVP
jgi:hypothetical protein